VSAAHLQPKVTDETSTTVAKGIVISTNPAEGNNVKAGTVVTLFVSAGQQQVTVPNVVGESASAAESQLTKLGLTVKEVTDSTSSQPAGTVTKQTPSGNAQVSPGSAVTISVSGGEVAVQSVVGDSAATAQTILQGQGFNVVTKTLAGPAGSTPGNVFQQQPAPQTMVAPKSTVTIYVAAQPASPSASPTPSATQPAATPTPTPSASTGGPGGNGNGNGGNGNGNGGGGGN